MKVFFIPLTVHLTSLKPCINEVKRPSQPYCGHIEPFPQGGRSAGKIGQLRMSKTT